MSQLPVVGWRELVDLPTLGLPPIPAKIDSGARTSSLHGSVIEQFDRDGEQFVRFSVNFGGLDHLCEAVHVDLRGITSSNGEAQQRFVIKVPMIIGEKRFRAEVTLADRSQMKFPMLIGRSALRRRFTVDCGRSWLQTKSHKTGAG